MKQKELHKEFDYIIHPSQEKNPLWKHLNVKFQIDSEQKADFLLLDSRISIIFISLKYYYSQPLYLSQKLDYYLKSRDYKNYNNRFLFLLQDCQDNNDYLTNIQEQCYNLEITLVIGFSFEDIAEYFKNFLKIKKNFNKFISYK